jgi:3-deoxy-D-manno-octulosonic-acid transferase
VRVLQVHNAIRIVSTAAFADTLVAILHHIDEARAMGQRGREVFDAQAGATARTVEALTVLLEENAVCRR